MTEQTESVSTRKRVARVGSAAAITMVGGTIFVDGQPASAATFNVTNLNAAGNGSLFKAVQDANAAAGPDTILFAAGLAGEINIGSTTLKVSDDLTITGPGSAVLTVSNMGVGENNLIYLYNEASLTISGLTLDDAAKDAIATNTAVLVPPAVHAGNITLTDVVIDDAYEEGIDVNNVRELTLIDSVVTRSGDSGIEGYHVEDVVITNSTFNNNNDYGVYFDQVVGNVTVDGAAFVLNDDEGLSIDSVTGNIVVQNSTFAENYANGLYIDTATGNVTVSDSTFDDHDYEKSLYISGITGDVVVQRVDVNDAGDYGIYIESITGSVTVQDVNVNNSYGAALVVDTVSGPVLVERFTSVNAGDEAIDVDEPASTVTLRDITVRNTIDDNAIVIDRNDLAGGSGNILLERVSIDRAYGGIEIDLDNADLTPATVTMRDIDVTGAIDGESIYVRDAGDTVVDGLTVTDAYGTEFEDSLGSVSITNATFDTIFEDDAIEIDDPVGDVTITDVDMSTVYYGIDVNNAEGAITVQRVTIDTTWNYGVALDQDTTAVGNVLVEDVSIGQTFDGDALEIRAYDDVIVRRFELSDGGGEYGIEIDRATSVIIEDVSVKRTLGDGVGVTDVTGTVSISDVSVVNAYEVGLNLRNIDGATTVDSVTVYDSNDEGIKVFGQDGALTMTDVHVEQTESEGIEIDDATLQPVILQRVTVEGADSGGIDADNVSDLRIVNSTISGNRDDDTTGAGGIELYQTTASIRHSTIADNDGALYAVAVPGAAIRLETNSTLTVDHSIVAANNSVDSFGQDGIGNTITVTDSIVDVGTGLAGSTIEADPELGPLQDNGGPTPTMKPLPGSPAIDGGDAGIAGEPATDQRGFPRKNGVIDIGAVEITAGVVSVGTPDVTVAEDAGTADITLTRTGGQDGEATVDFDTADGSATAGLDFTAVSDTVTFADNQVSATVSVPILEDATNEGDETFTATISSPTTVTLGAPTTAEVTITNVVSTSGAITPLAEPQRFADTRAVGETIDDISEKTGKLAAGEEIEVQITGRGGVPADAVGVVMNITAINAEGIGFITAHGCVTPRPLASSLNYTAGVNLGNEVVAGLSADGSVCLYTSTATDLAVDVVGYISASSPLENVTPARLLDTRPTGETIDDVAEGGGPLAAGSQTTLQVGGRAGVPADAAAVIVNVTAINPTGIGFVTVHPCVDPRPLASSLNYVAGVNRGNELIASLNADGELCIYTSTETQLAVDVVGYLPAGTNLNSVTPARLLDSRPGESTVDGTSAGVGKFAAGEEYTLQVGGRAGVPATATAAIVNVTAIQAEAAGFVTVHPCVDPRPLASSLNYVPGVNGGNEIVASLNADGELCLYTFAAAHLAVDVVGYLE